MDANSLPVLSRVRQPEYTGENRCIPCTIVNVAIATGIAIALGAVWLEVGALALIGSLALIYLRGYLVPGTPWFTARFFPDRVLAWFEKAPLQEGEQPATPDELDLESWLFDHGVVDECQEIDDLCLADGFATRWYDEIAELREREAEREELATILDLPDDELEFREFGKSFAAYHRGRRVGQWESRGALLADLGAARVLEATTDGWDALAIDQRGTVLHGLRVFLERCPVCDGPVEMEEETVRSCCRSKDVVAVACDECGARLLEAEHPG